LHSRTNEHSQALSPRTSHTNSETLTRRRPGIARQEPFQLRAQNSVGSRCRYMAGIRMETSAQMPAGMVAFVRTGDTLAPVRLDRLAPCMKPSKSSKYSSDALLKTACTSVCPLSSALAARRSHMAQMMRRSLLTRCGASQRESKKSPCQLTDETGQRRHPPDGTQLASEVNTPAAVTAATGPSEADAAPTIVRSQQNSTRPNS
jgi:hypothetical protein